MIVNLKSGSAFRGVVWRHRGPYVMIRNAQLLQADGAQPLSLDGEVVVQQRDVDFIQVL